jgi:hypothetical protein
VPPRETKVFYANERDIPVRFRRLTRIVGMLSGVDGVREDLIAEIRDEIERGEYLTEEKLNEAIYRLLREIMADEERVS